jgi:hypothetical protein
MGDSLLWFSEPEKYKLDGAKRATAVTSLLPRLLRRARYGMIRWILSLAGKNIEI